MRFLKKIVKNKVLALSICIVVVSLVYTGIQKVIDNHNFKNNNDFVVDEEINAGENVLEDKADGKTEENESDYTEGGVIDEEETNLELEGGDDISEKQEDTIEKSKIYVYITGEVNIPGVVILKEGSRIVDAINAAGGTTANADISKVNLVYVLNDGMKVNIPNSNDLKNNTNFEYITVNSGEGGNPPNGSDTLDRENNGGDKSQSEKSSSSKRNYIVNINTASQTELETLPGIGPSLALKIINYRKDHGKFSSIEQIMEVNGIGENKFEKLKKYISI